MSVLIIAEHDNGQLKASVRNMLSAAHELDTAFDVMIIGYQCQEVAKQAATLPGVQTVWCADNVCYEHKFAENISKLVSEFANPYSTIMMASTTFGKNTLPRIAALLGVAQVTDVTRILDKDTFEHPIYAGNAIEKVQILDDKKILAIRTIAFDTVEGAQAPCPIKPIEKIIPHDKTVFIRHELNVSTRPELSNAKVVVSGGRGLQSAEKFKLIEELADALGAAIGASRAAVDAGFVANDYQVGQTGKIVAPTLYFAVGISGAIQHLAGMKDSKIIVAINKDQDAPIFQVATYGLVGDLFIIIPELIGQLKKRKLC